MVIVAILLGISVYTMFAIPYDEAVRLWRGGESVWYQNPRQAPPAWFNIFSAKKLPVSFAMSSASSQSARTVTTDAQGSSEIVDTYTFDFQYDEFPQELALYFTAKFGAKQPFTAITWLTPDGRTINVTTMSLRADQAYRFAQDEKFKRLMKGKAPVEALFSDPNAAEPTPLKGTYQLVITTSTFEKDSAVDTELVMHGQLYGWAGTDHLRRDLGVALLWGTPIALAFGLLAALGTTLTSMIISAFGVWFGGWVDEAIQRVTELNLVLPFLPILIMIGTFYSRSIWLMLGATILLNIFGGAIKTYRAVFMQVKESPYIEAARSYGASDARIIFQYLTPRIIPMLVPQLVTLIPTYVFIEASLAVLGLGDPILPTWGKVINDAQANGAPYQGLYYWVLEPAVLLMITGLAFALLGFALDRVFNPRLRGV